MEAVSRRSDPARKGSEDAKLQLLSTGLEMVAKESSPHAEIPPLPKVAAVPRAPIAPSAGGAEAGEGIRT